MTLLREFAADMWDGGWAGRAVLIYMAVLLVATLLFMCWVIPADVACRLGHTPWPLENCS